MNDAMNLQIICPPIISLLRKLQTLSSWLVVTNNVHDTAQNLWGLSWQAVITERTRVKPVLGVSIWPIYATRPLCHEIFWAICIMKWSWRITWRWGHFTFHISPIHLSVMLIWDLSDVYEPFWLSHILDNMGFMVHHKGCRIWTDLSAALFQARGIFCL